MKIVKNEKLIARNGKIGQWMSLASLVVLGLGLYISFSMPEYFAHINADLGHRKTDYQTDDRVGEIFRH